MDHTNKNRPIDKSPRRIAAMFDSVAPRYDFLNHFLSAGIDRSWRRRTVDETLRRLSTETLQRPILDVATGTGDLAVAFVRGLERAQLGDQAASAPSSPCGTSGAATGRAGENGNPRPTEAGSAPSSAGGTSGAATGRAGENGNPRPTEAASAPSSVDGTSGAATCRAGENGNPRPTEAGSAPSSAGGTLGAATCCCVGVDFSGEMLRLAAEKVKKLGLSEKIAFQQADAMALPFEDGAFEAVSVGFGLRNMLDTDRGIAEMIRVCKPGGIVAILEFSIPSLPILSSLYLFYFKFLLPRIGRYFSRASGDSYAYFPMSVFAFDRPEAMKRRLSEAGLLEIEAISLTFGIATLYLGRKGQESGAGSKVL